MLPDNGSTRDKWPDYISKLRLIYFNYSVHFCNHILEENLVKRKSLTFFTQRSRWCRSTVVSFSVFVQRWTLHLSCCPPPFESGCDWNPSNWIWEESSFFFSQFSPRFGNFFSLEALTDFFEIVIRLMSGSDFVKLHFKQRYKGSLLRRKAEILLSIWNLIFVRRSI